MVRWVAITIGIVFFLFGNYSYIDLVEALEFYGSKLSPTHPIPGQIIIVLLFLLIIFTDEIIFLYKKYMGRIKVKDSF